MSKGNEFDQFLEQQTESGEALSEGSFSISLEKAVEKLARFQMPFEGAWALKIIQSAVSSGTIKRIAVKITRKHTQFRLEGEWNWTLEQVEDALLAPAFQGASALVHLVTALRFVGFNQKREFWFGAPTLEEAIVWDGETLSRAPCGKNHDHVLLKITNSASTEKSGFFSGFRPKKCGIATVTKLLSTRAHTCPIALAMDTRRLDALEQDSRHGWGPQSQLMQIRTCLDESLPPLKVPQGTLEGLTKAQVLVEQGLLEATKEVLNNLELSPVCGIAYLLSAHLKSEPGAAKPAWKDKESCSFLNWVKDGVVIQSESLDSKPGFCSVGLFLSAEGLGVDLSSFRLLESPEKAKRTAIALSLLIRDFEHKRSNKIEFIKITEKANRENRDSRNTFLALGLLTFPFSFLCGVLYSGMVMFAHHTSSSSQRQREEQFQKGIHDLKIRLQDALQEREIAES